jgi:hypothetical protein
LGAAKEVFQFEEEIVEQLNKTHFRSI